MMIKRFIDSTRNGNTLEYCLASDVEQLEQENEKLRSLCKKLFESHDGVGLSVLQLELAEMGFMGQVNGKQLKGCE